MAHEARTWQYRTVPANPEPDLEALSRDGWELKAATHNRLYFMRPAHDFRERVTLDQKRRYYALWGVTAGEAGEGAG